MTKKERELLGQIAKKLGVKGISMWNNGYGYWFFEYVNSDRSITIHNIGEGVTKKDRPEFLQNWLQKLTIDNQ